MTTPSMYNLQRGTRVGAYVIGEAIGLGASQVAYLADSPKGQKVVIKMSLFPKGQEGSDDRRRYERFLRQVDLFFRLRGTEGVAEISGCGMFPDEPESEFSHPYLVQKPVPGGVNILDWFRKEPHPLKTIIEAWAVLATACARMRQLNVCHRDLKPENILMTPDGVPTIVDFDSALCVEAERLTRQEPGYWPGTMAYYSPEVCETLQRDPSALCLMPFHSLAATDLHALGVILYEVLTGEYPFDEDARGNELLKEIAKHVPNLPTKLNPDVPWGLQKVTLKLLKKDPELRYETGGELAGELWRLLDSKEDWDRPFQTPGEGLRSAPTRSRTSSTSPSTPAATDGSAALGVRTRWLTRTKIAVAAAAAVALIACAHFMGLVLTGEKEWLAQCSPESRKVVHELGLSPDEGVAVVLPGPNAIIQPYNRGLEVRDGPVEVSASIPARDHGKEAHLYGIIRTGTDGATIHFTKMRVFQEGDQRGDPPSGPERDICAVGVAVDQPRDPGGIPKVEVDFPPDYKPHPGFIFVTSEMVNILFAD